MFKNKGSKQPKSIKSIWDNKEETADRYVIVFHEKHPRETSKYNLGLILSNNPDSPQGISLWGEVEEGRHLGEKIIWKSLPEHVQDHIIERIEEEI